MQIAKIGMIIRLGWVFGLAAVLCGAAAPQKPIYGMWENPRGTVQVRTGACGANLCGWITWATDEAIRDAREGGTEHLIGTEIMQDYKQTDKARWEGHVFVPDWGNSFYSTIRQLNNDNIRVSGCILHGLVCKSQLWHRL